ncbi:MAG: type I-D CRISPR-associated protein Cas5/Csc1 [Candidatus Heimdallarchaeaceae archaeon]
MKVVYECTLTPYDFLFFVSREFNLRSSMDLFIHNYSLMYALKKEFNIIARSYKPNYEDELFNLDYYCTPAFPINQVVSCIQTYNSIDTLRNTPSDPKKRIRNIPSFGQYKKIVPLKTKYRFYILSFEEIEKKERIVRLGKKLAPCKLQLKQMQVQNIVKEPKNPVSFDIAINLLDSSSNDKILQSSIHYMLPTPIITDTLALIPHIVAVDPIENRKVRIPIPKHFQRKKGEEI